MCGIAGIIQESPIFRIESIKKMTDSLAHRGPEGEGEWQNSSGTVLLGHRRLSIIDLSAAAAQPMHYLGRYSIVHNGEIYNYIELRNELGKKGYVFHTHSDTEVIIAAYDCWQEECVHYFDGMFAFAIWDETERELFAARDRFGEKPFFYHIGNGCFLFASEMKAIWAAGVERVANLKMLFNFITIGYADNPARPEETFFDNISKLPPASRLYYSPVSKELHVEKYWEIDPDADPIVISDHEATGRFEELLRQSVNRRLRSDVSVGTSLSGGLDSSAITAMIHESGQAFSHQCFTAIFPGFEKDESGISKMVADNFQLQQHTIPVKLDDFLANWEKFMHHQEEPVSSASAFAQYTVFRLAKEKDITVLLDGQGADETMAGYMKYYKWYWQELFQKRKLARSREISLARQNGITEKFGWKNVVASLFPDLASVILERQYLVHALQQEDLSHDFIKLQSKEAYYTTPEFHSLNGVLYFNSLVHGLEELLRYADRNSMAHGREVRLPFLQHELVEFLFSLPSSFKIRRGWTKWLLRESMNARLPADITWRKGKTGFEPPQRRWMEDQRMQEMIRDAKKKLVDEKILKPETLQKPIRPSAAYDAEAYDWRYLAAAAYLQGN